jgi:hypothetical protein
MVKPIPQCHPRIASATPISRYLIAASRRHFVGTFIHKRNCADLDADHFGGDTGMS